MATKWKAIAEQRLDMLLQVAEREETPQLIKGYIWGTLLKDKTLPVAFELEILRHLAGVPAKGASDEEA